MTGRFIEQFRVTCKTKNAMLFNVYVYSLHLVNQELLRESNRTFNIGAKTDLLKYEVDKKSYYISEKLNSR